MSDSAIPWIVACQSPLSMGISREEYWSGLLWPPPGDLPDPGIQPVFYISCIGRQVLPTSATWVHENIPLVHLSSNYGGGVGEGESKRLLTSCNPKSNNHEYNLGYGK